MGAVLLATIAAASWGTTDFLGGQAARKHSSLSVTFWKNVFQTGSLFAIALFLHSTLDGRDLILGAVSGITGGVALAIFYWALSKGNVSVVASVAGVTLAAVPACFGIVTGDSISAFQAFGLAICVIAVALVSIEKDERVDRQHIRVAVVAGLVVGVGAGIFFIIIGKAHDSSGLWPLVASDLTAFIFLFLLAYFIKKPVELSVSAARISLPPAIFDDVGQVCFYVATHAALLTITAVVSSMAPAVTVLLAIILLKERPGIVRSSGLLLSVVGIGVLAAFH